ncbi:MAG: DUF4350 domain-containing protein [Armatimonadota bacterium]
MRLSSDLRIILIALAVLAAGCLLVCRTQSGPGLEAIPKRSTYLAAPGGLKALYQTMDRLGYRVERHNHPLTASPKDGVLFMVSPETPIGRREIEPLRRWVERGNLLVYVEDDILGDMDDTVRSNSKRLLPTPLSQGMKRAVTVGDERVPEKWGLGDICLFSSRTMEERVLAPILGDEKGPIAAYSSWGRGGVLVLSDSWLLSNRGIAQGDNLLLALNAAGHGGTVTFDEYHHGYGVGEGVMSLIGRPAKYGIAQLLAAFLVLFLAVAPRFGKPVPLAEGGRQRSEYLGSLSSLFARAKATDVVKDELTRKFREDVARSLGVRPSAEAEEVLAAVESARPEMADRFARLVSEGGDESALVALEHRRRDFRKELMSKR